MTTPTNVDPKVISIDTESYGKVEGMPVQTCFTARKCVEVDGATVDQLVVTAAITLPKEDPRWQSDGDAPGVGITTPRTTAPTAGWNAERLSNLKPGHTLVLRPARRRELHMLVRWLRYADTLIGMNLLYDLGVLRARHPLLANELDGRHTLIDLGVVNYLQCEGRTERGLKTLGPVLGKYVYDEGDLQEKLPDGEQLEDYNAQDTHNTMTAVAHLAGMIHRAGGTDKLSEWCVKFYSDTIWSCLRMTEAGVPMDVGGLVELEGKVRRKMEGAAGLAEKMYGVKVTGEGSVKSRGEFMRRMVDAAPGNALDHPLMEFTEKKRELSLGERNRTLLSSMLPEGHKLRRVCGLLGKHGHAQKLHSSYILPLLKGSTVKKGDRTGVLVPQEGVGLCLAKDGWKREEGAGTSDQSPNIIEQISQLSSGPPKKERSLRSKRSGKKTGRKSRSSSPSAEREGSTGSPPSVSS